MLRRTMLAVAAILVVTTLVATACGPTPTPQVVKETVVVEKEVEVTKVVEVEKEVEVVVTATPEPVAEAETIVIGGFGPLSAPGSFQAGTQMRQATEMAVEGINEAGGVLGKKVELVFGDTEGLPERGTAVTERLITQDKVVALTGEYHSGVALTEMEVAHKYGIPVVFAEPWADDVTGKGYPEVFRLSPSIEYYTTVPVEYNLTNGFKTYVYVLEETDYGRLQGEEFVKQYTARGIPEEDIMTIFADPATEDFTPILQRIMQDPPDLLGCGVTGIAGFRFVKQACELGLAPTAKTVLYATVDAFYPEYWENVGECGQYTLFSYVGLPKSVWNEKTEAFMTKFEERYGQVPGTHAMEAYDATYLLAKAIEDAGSTDPQAIISALETIKYTGALGELWFEYGSQNPVPADQPAWMWHQWPTPSVFIMQYLEVNQAGDDAVVVWPRERATGPTYTAPPK
jgi:branched-chain amino acid transport system substrate-binding protein